MLFPIRVEASRYVAERIPGARFVELPPGDPVVWALDQSEFLALVREFLTGAWEAGRGSQPSPIASSRRFSSPTSSAPRSARRSWATRAGAIWSSAITRSSGNSSSAFVDARSTRPVTASSRVSTGLPVRCAAPAAIVAAVPELGLDVRAGLHTGECELIDGKPGGFAVVVGCAHRLDRSVRRSVRFEHRQGSRSRVGNRVRRSGRARAEGCSGHMEPSRGRLRLDQAARLAALQTVGSTP